MQKFNDNPKIKIKSINFIGNYTVSHGVLTNDKCTLCKSLLSQSNADLINVIIIGKCGHCFHKSCYHNWQISGNLSCPLDSTLWQSKSEYIFQ